MDCSFPKVCPTLAWSSLVSGSNTSLKNKTSLGSRPHLFVSSLLALVWVFDWGSWLDPQDCLSDLLTMREEIRRSVLLLANTMIQQT
ncbi:uncharacterized protein K441DRAFT_664998 [Cenococcum geophilum 1.58]|uniref:uncharacterized protein n=1 Tax=Cenococcum geophilum 1.58 TaxID=794803 RepID=UPI00358EF580|nr:hypothetical protein K441DRAFT_664998 [Cenococcum geophilum 1.58]